MDTADRTDEEGTRSIVKQAISRRDALRASAAFGIGAAGVHVMNGAPVRTAVKFAGCCSCSCCVTIVFNQAAGRAELQFLPSSTPIGGVFLEPTGALAKPAQYLTARASKLTVGDLHTLRAGLSIGPITINCGKAAKVMEKYQLKQKDMISIGKAFDAYDAKRPSAPGTT